MSFFKLYQPRQYGYRFIYYDPKKEAHKDREKRMYEETQTMDRSFKTSIHRGSFREQSEKNKNVRANQLKQSNIRVIIILFILLALLYYFLK